MVPEFEEREAARWGGYRWIDYADLPIDERVQAVAHYRVSTLIEIYRGDAVRRGIEQETARRRAAGSGR